MLGSLILFCVSVHNLQSQYTISNENTVIAPSTTTETGEYFAPASRARGETKYTFDRESGEITCRTADTAVSNCDIVELLRGDHTFMDNIHYRQGGHLMTIEVRVPEELAQL